MYLLVLFVGPSSNNFQISDIESVSQKCLNFAWVEYVSFIHTHVGYYFIIDMTFIFCVCIVLTLDTDVFQYVHSFVQ